MKVNPLLLVLNKHLDNDKLLIERYRRDQRTANNDGKDNNIRLEKKAEVKKELLQKSNKCITLTINVRI